MSTRHDLLALLADGAFHSGTALGDRLGVSRAAVNKAVQALIEAANSGNKDAAYSAVQALSKIGPAAQQAVPALRRLQDSSDDFYVRRAASEALETIDVKTNPKADKLGMERVE